LKEALEDSSKKMREGANEIQQTKQELSAKHHDNNVIDQLKSIISEKEAKIRALERQLRELQADLVSLNGNIMVIGKAKGDLFLGKNTRGLLAS
jgi:septal ring factor EnvC (AmiA/AmiB activator)